MSNDPQLVDHGDALATHPTTSWIEEVSGVAVMRSTALVGGMSSNVARHELTNGRSVVSRHITNTEWLEREPHLIENEAAALRLLADTEVRAPELIAIAPGQLAMSFVPGEMLVTPGELRERAIGLAEVAQQIHRVRLPVDLDLPPWRPWALEDLSPPRWGDQVLWTEAIETFQSMQTPTANHPVLLHRDLHPLNILWEGDQAHVVDWVNACVGHPHAELGHCRWNLSLLAGSVCADSFLDAYLDGSETYDSYWDLAPAMSFLPGPPSGSGWRAVGRTDLTRPVVIQRTEAFVRRALGS